MTQFKGTINALSLRRIQQKLKELGSAPPKTDQRNVGRAVTLEMKALISAGVSPIAKKGRLPSYKDSYKKQIKGELAFYRDDQSRLRVFNPGKRRPPYSKKTLRPVNLTLTGAFLKALTWRLITNGVQIFYKGKPEDDKERGHREGANKQKKRPTIPNAPQETFAVSIQEKILDILDKRIQKIIKR